MARIENTVFISYRRTDVYTALAVYENLKNQGYDVFFDYRSISSGDFEQIITSNIRARAHFLLILTPTALDRLNEPGDWLRREIETAIDEKRNIIPLFFKGFRFGTPALSDTLAGKLRNLGRYNGLNVHEDYFDEAMQRLRTQYLNIPLDTVLHPVSTLVQKVVMAEQVAADKALEQIEDVKELVKQGEENPVQLPEPDPMPVLKASEPVASSPEEEPGIPAVPFADIPGQRKEVRIKPEEILREKVPDLKRDPRKTESGSKASRSLSKQKIFTRNLNFRLMGGIAGGVLLLALLIWGGANIFQDTPVTSSTPTRNTPVTATQTSQPLATNTPPPTKASISPTPTRGIGSTMTGKDGVTLLYIPAGEFVMGQEGFIYGVQTVTLDAFWIDKTEVTNAMYAKCVQAGTCNAPGSKRSATRESYYGDPQFDNYPVVEVTWNDARTYCSWVDRDVPTGAEWEKAARGTDDRQYPWGNDVPNNNLLNYNNETGDTTEVGKYPNGASPYGALDMAGNVMEWVDTVYDTTNDPYFGEYYEGVCSSHPGECVVRGGSWQYPGNSVYSFQRFSYYPWLARNYIGFRCAMSATP